ncbi:MAG: SH3 domain-containing protein, partial [Polyangiaceae bacterium]
RRSSDLALSKPAAPAAVLTNHQRVVVGEGRIERCYNRKKRLDAAQCGRLKVSRVLVPPLKQLANCPSALGLGGEVRVGFELRFGKRKKELRVLHGKAKGLPSSTVRGIERCIADFMRDVSLDGIAHKYSRYRVYYTLNFYPPGTEIETEPREDEGEEPGAAAARGLATVVWDSALVRSEPRVGKIVSRLVRGTQVKILGRRKDWYRVRVTGKDGWVYRGALGR